MRGASCIALLCIAALPAYAQVQNVESATLLEFGEFVSDHVEWLPAPNAYEGRIRNSRNTRLVEQTDQICPRQGLKFGIRYVLQGQPQAAPVSITASVVFPEQGILTALGERRTRSDFTFALRVGQPRGRTFSFEHERQMVHGTWAFEVRSESRLLLRKEFTVVCAIT